MIFRTPFLFGFRLSNLSALYLHVYAWRFRTHSLQYVCPLDVWLCGRKSVGSKEIPFYYIACGVGAGLFQEAAQFVQFYMKMSDVMPGISVGNVFSVAHGLSASLNSWTTVGASGAIYAILLAFGMIFPEDRIFIFPIPVPIKAKYFVIGYAAIELFSAIATTGDGVAHIAHLGGMVFGFFMIRYWRKQIDGGYGGSRARMLLRRCVTPLRANIVNSSLLIPEMRTLQTMSVSKTGIIIRKSKLHKKR